MSRMLDACRQRTRSLPYSAQGGCQCEERQYRAFRSVWTCLLHLQSFAASCACSSVHSIAWERDVHGTSRMRDGLFSVLHGHDLTVIMRLGLWGMRRQRMSTAHDRKIDVAKDDTRSIGIRMDYCGGREVGLGVSRRVPRRL